MLQNQIERQTIFEVELHYLEGKSKVLSRPGRVGSYLGSGEGSIASQTLAGRVHWDLFEKVEETLCESNLRGLIETDDGARIEFDTLGFFRPPREPGSHTWVNAAAVTFHTDDDRYRWLNDLVCSWQGVFDMSSYQHHYFVTVPHNIG